MFIVYIVKLNKTRHTMKVVKVLLNKELLVT